MVALVQERGRRYGRASPYRSPSSIWPLHECLLADLFFHRLAEARRAQELHHRGPAKAEAVEVRHLEAWVEEEARCLMEVEVEEAEHCWSEVAAEAEAEVEGLHRRAVGAVWKRLVMGVGVEVMLDLFLVVVGEVVRN